MLILCVALWQSKRAFERCRMTLKVYLVVQRQECLVVKNEFVR